MTQVSAQNAQLVKSDDYLPSIEQQPQQKKKKKKNNHIAAGDSSKGFGKDDFPGGVENQELRRNSLDVSQEEKKKKKRPKVKKDPKESKEPKEKKEPKTPKAPKIPKEPKEKKAKTVTPKPKSSKKSRTYIQTSPARLTLQGPRELRKSRMTRRRLVKDYRF